MQIVQIQRNYDFQGPVLAASLRHPQHVVGAALAGAIVAYLHFQAVELM
jgi:transaldolase